MRHTSRTLGQALVIYSRHGSQLALRRTAGPRVLPLLRMSIITQVSRFHTSTPTPKPTWGISAPEPPSIHPHASRSVSLPLHEQLRGLMRLMAHSVVICTSALPENTPPLAFPPRNSRDKQQQEQMPPQSTDSPLDSGDHASPSTAAEIHDHPVPRAMTMSSFTSLALSPVPVVTFNVAVPSRTLDAVASSGKFNIHVLAGDVAGAAIADRFSRGNAEEGVGPALESDDACGVEWGGLWEEPPVLRGMGVLYVLRCRVLEEEGEDGGDSKRGLVRVKDHVIVLGEVMEILEGEGRGEDGDGEGVDVKFGLVYADRRYRILGDVLSKGGKSNK